MSKYQFYRMSGDTFQQMVQALLEKKRRNYGNLVQFSSIGADGAREATWTQTSDHPEYMQPANAQAGASKEWVFQVKFHDIGVRGWSGAGSAVVADLQSELEKVTTKYGVPCHHFVLITNVPLTGARRIGTRDRISKISQEWHSKIPAIEVWDASDLSRMLDNNSDVRTSYSELILPGDVLTALYRQIQGKSDRITNTFRAYLKFVVEHESKARAEEVGDEDALPLSKVFIDQSLCLDTDSVPECYLKTVKTWISNSEDDTDEGRIMPNKLDDVSSSFPLLWGANEKVMLLAGPGYGKSTVTQFLALYHASRIVKSDYANVLAGRLKLPAKWTASDLDAACTVRFPFRVELRRYAKWRRAQLMQSAETGFASYIARQLIGTNVESDLKQDDIFGLISTNPTLVILDGFDEVPNKEDRDGIIKNFDAFLYRCAGEEVDLQIVMSSRPQGYLGEFDRFQPLTWGVNDLKRADFDEYCAAWLTERIKNSDEQAEANERITRGMLSDAVRQLATTLLQATVMLIIARRKSDIPEERHKLFAKYVDVDFEREKLKYDLVAQYEKELRLLHEIVGYQIHETVGKGGNGAMPESAFKDAVYKVWRLLRGDEEFVGILNRELDKIFNLATDRLVFLSGKGANQSDIDFVIQSYREYFAAEYLANHTDVDPDKVYANLANRGAYWQNVLRFYAAMSTPKQQALWANEAVWKSLQNQSVTECSTILRTRRTGLMVLPEYGRFQFEQFRRTVVGILPESEWWTWINQDWAFPILCNLRSGSAWRELWKIFKLCEVPSRGSAEFALSLFPRAISHEDAEYIEWINLLTNWLTDPQLKEQVVFLTLSFNLPVDLTRLSAESACSALRKLHYQSTSGILKQSELIKRLSMSQATRFLCTISHRLPSSDTDVDVWNYLNLPLEVENVVIFNSSTARDHPMYLSKPYWLRVNARTQDEANMTDSGNDDCYVHYVTTLYSAIQRMDDELLCNRAESLMRSLPEMPAWYVNCETVLGLSPSRFNAVSDWKLHRKLMRRVYANQAEIQSLIDVASTLSLASSITKPEWTLLLFHPSQWDELSKVNLISTARINELKASLWAQAASLSNVSVPFADFYSPYGSAPTALNIPFFAIMAAAVELHNKSDLQDSELASDILEFSDPTQVGHDEISAIIGLIDNPSSFPKTWLSALMQISIQVAEVDLDQLVCFWQQATESRKVRFWFYPSFSENSTIANKIAALLIAHGNDFALDLAVTVLRHQRNADSELLRQLNARAVAQIPEAMKDDRRFDILMDCLLITLPSTEEIRLYTDKILINRVVLHAPNILSVLSHRLRSLPQSFSIGQLSTLKVPLQTILSQRSEFPLLLVTAALDTLIQIEISEYPPLTENDWHTDCSLELITGVTH